MAHIVTLPNGETAEFPDEMSDEQISGILKQHMAGSAAAPAAQQPSQAPPQNMLQKAGNVAGVFNKDIESIPGKVGDWAFNTLNQAPSEISGAVGQTFNPAKTGRVLKNLLVGTSDIEKGVLNIPYSGMKYLSHLGVISPEQAEKTLHMEHEPIGDYIRSTMGDEQAGDKLIQALPGLAPVGPKGLSIGKDIGKSAANVVTGASKYEALKDSLSLGKLEKEASEAKRIASEAETAHATDESLEEKAKYEAKAKGLPTEPATLESNISKHEEKLNETNKNIAALSHQMENMPPAPKVEPSDISHIENANNATRAREEADQNLQYAREHHNLASQIIPESDRQIAHHLNQGSDFPVNTSRQIKHEIESTNDYWSNEYNNQMRDLKDTNFQLLNPERAPEIRSAIENARATYGDDPHGDFARVLNMAPDYASMSAHDFMRDQKQFRNGINNLYRQAQYEGRNGNPARADQLFKAARSLKPFEDLVSETLMEGLGENASRYKYIQNGYKTQVYPLRENRVASKILEGHKLSEDIAGELAGDSEGQELLRGMANRNPQIQRNIVGQQYKKNPDLVHNPDERLREYTNNMPELNRMVNTRNQAQNSINQAAHNVETATRQQQDALQRETAAKNVSKEAKNLSSKAQQEAFKKIVERENQQNKLQLELGKHHDEIKKIESQLPQLREHFDKLTEASNKTGLSLERKIKAKAAAKEASDKLREAQRSLRSANFGYKRVFSMIRKLKNLIPVVRKL